MSYSAPVWQQESLLHRSGPNMGTTWSAKGDNDVNFCEFMMLTTESHKVLTLDDNWCLNMFEHVWTILTLLRSYNQTKAWTSANWTQLMIGHSPGHILDAQVQASSKVSQHENHSEWNHDQGNHGLSKNFWNAVELDTAKSPNSPSVRTCEISGSGVLLVEWTMCRQRPSTSSRSPTLPWPISSLIFSMNGASSANRKLGYGNLSAVTLRWA